MLRITALIALIATPLAAQDKETLCNTSGEIVRAGVAERNGGADEATAIKNVTEALPDDKAKFRPAVEPLVQWVFTEPVEHLTEELAKAYIAKCLAN